MPDLFIALATVLILAAAACQIIQFVKTPYGEPNSAIFTARYKGVRAAVSGMAAVFVIIFAALATSVYFFISR
jgi:hypothetical protein